MPQVKLFCSQREAQPNQCYDVINEQREQSFKSKKYNIQVNDKENRVLFRINRARVIKTKQTEDLLGFCIFWGFLFLCVALCCGFVHWGAWRPRSAGKGAPVAHGQSETTMRQLHPSTRVGLLVYLWSAGRWMSHISSFPSSNHQPFPPFAPSSPRFSLLDSLNLMVLSLFTLPNGWLNECCQLEQIVLSNRYVNKTLISHVSCCKQHVFITKASPEPLNQSEHAATHPAGQSAQGMLAISGFCLLEPEFLLI